MLNRDFASGTSNIGMRAVAPAAIPANQPNLGLMLADGMKAYNEKKEYDKEQEKLSAYATALKEQHPEDAARIDAMGALKAGAWYDALAKDENGLDPLSASTDSIADAERQRKLAAIDQMEQSGKWTHEQAEMQRARVNLGEIAAGGEPGNVYGLEGIDDTTYKKERTKNYLADEKAYFEAKANVDDIETQTNEVLSLLNQDPSIVGPFSGWNEKLKVFDQRNGNIDQRRQWLEARGEITNRLITLGNVMIKYANDHGVTGINSLPEVERNTEGLTANSSPEKIRGAIKSIKKAAKEIEQKQAKKLNMYRSGGQPQQATNDPFNIR